MAKHMKLKTKLLTTLLALALLLAALPTKPLAAQEPPLLQYIHMYFSEDVFIVLSNVYEFYVPFGYGRSIYMGEGGSIRFMGADAPAGLYTGRTYFFEELSLGGSAVSFGLGRCPTTGDLVWADYMALIGGTYTWVAQIILNKYFTFEDHTAALATYGRYSLFRHTWQAPTTVAPIIPGITIRPPDIFEDDDLLITFTDVYNFVGRADIATQSMVWFYLAPTGTVSFNRDLELTHMFDGGARFETTLLPAGEAIPLAAYEDVSFLYGIFPVEGHHSATEREHSFAFRIANPSHLPILPGENDHNAQITNFAVDVGGQGNGLRTLRFPIGSTTFTDNGVSRTLEAPPFIAQDRTMVPLRVIGEALGATNLDLTDGVVTFTIHGQDFSMAINQPLPGGMGTPVIIADRTFVPLGFIVAEMGAQARWCPDARAAYIYIP